ncbi:MAG TPA: hypothetical protein VEN28_03590 [Burkholderiaceae bacterium]|nr:hypothetical protein [Burkholderiaceae bacterium]
MNQGKSIAIAICAVVVVAALSTWQLLTGLGTRDDAKADLSHATAAEVAYPPPLPYWPPVAIRTPGKNEVELCGYGSVDPERVPGIFEAEANAAILRVATEFEHRADERRRALGLVTRALIDAEAADRGVMAEDPQKCREAAGLCDERAAEAFARAATPAIEALTRLAVTTRDPETYVVALRACRSIIPNSPPTSCNALTLDQWAQLDQDNAFAWLLTARAAQIRKDPIGFQDALRRASHAKSFERRPTPYGEILAGLDVRAEPVRTLIVGKLAAAEAREDPADYFSNFTMFTIYCTNQSEPGRRELCNDLAHVMTELSTDPLAAQVGDQIAAKAGWPVERRTAARTKHAALDAERPVRSPGSARLTCDGAAQTEEWLVGVAKHGEETYLRALIAKHNAR